MLYSFIISWGGAYCGIRAALASCSPCPPTRSVPGGSGTGARSPDGTSRSRSRSGRPARRSKTSCSIVPSSSCASFLSKLTPAFRAEVQRDPSSVAGCVISNTSSVGSVCNGGRKLVSSARQSASFQLFVCLSVELFHLSQQVACRAVHLITPLRGTDLPG